jgi:fermentation-respiration switch protein FrsA (DUF1100 family)
VIGGFIASWFVAGVLVAANPRHVGKPPVDLNAVAFTVPSDSGSTISGWHTTPAQCDGVVILLHGIRGSRLSMLERARLLHAEGFATIMIDLQAHGESPGDAITLGHMEKHDVRAAVEFARRKHPRQPIGVIGVSLGGAAAVLASPLNIDAAVIESVYPDVDTAIHNRVAARLGLLSSLPSELLLVQLQPRLGISRSELRPIDHIPNIDCPVLVASGTADLHTTAEETQAIYDAAREPKECWLVDGAAHVDLLSHSPVEYRDRVIKFLRSHLHVGVEVASKPDAADLEQIPVGS